MDEINIKSTNEFIDTLNNIKLFAQYKYCFNYIKNNNPDLEEEIIAYHSEISSSCFRQSLEFLNSALQTSLSTSPLLYSYCLNNLIKGATYLKNFDEDVLYHFGKHGFSIPENLLKDNLLDTSISLWKNGATIAILKIMNNHIIEPQQIKFSALLSRIPEISSIFIKSTGQSSYTANIIDKNEYKFPYIQINDEQNKEIFELIGLVNNNSQSKNLICFMNLIGQEYIKNNNLERDIFYNKYLILPQKFSEGIYSINILFYAYLIVMGYGMLVRYNAHKWERYIDPKVSEEYVLISLSLDECVKICIREIHNYLLGYKYINENYTDDDVRRVINQSIPDILKELEKEQEQIDFQYNL